MAILDENFANVDFSSSDLTQATFVSVDLTGAHFLLADLAGVRFIDNNLTSAVFCYANVAETEFGAGEYVDTLMTSANSYIVESPYMEVISPTLGESAVFEVGEDECGFDDVADLAGAGGGVAECSPAAGKDGESAFAQAAQSAGAGCCRCGCPRRGPGRRRVV